MYGMYYYCSKFVALAKILPSQPRAAALHIVFRFWLRPADAVTPWLISDFPHLPLLPPDLCVEGFCSWFWCLENAMPSVYPVRRSTSWFQSNAVCIPTGSVSYFLHVFFPPRPRDNSDPRHRNLKSLCPPVINSRLPDACL